MRFRLIVLLALCTPGLAFAGDAAKKPSHKKPTQSKPEAARATPKPPTPAPAKEATVTRHVEYLDGNRDEPRTRATPKQPPGTWAKPVDQEPDWDKGEASKTPPTTQDPHRPAWDQETEWDKRDERPPRMTLDPTRPPDDEPNPDTSQMATQF